MQTLQNSTNTSNVTAVEVLDIQNGSVVVTMVTFFDNAAPSAEDVQAVVASGDQLSDGDSQLPLVPNSVSVDGKCATVTMIPENCVRL